MNGAGNSLRMVMASAACVLGVLAACSAAGGDQLLVGAACGDITPAGPVALCGQFHLRIARKVETPLAANVIALESRRAGKAVDAAVMVACDLVYVPADVLAEVRRAVRKRAPEIDPMKIVLSATHTHTAPVLLEGKYPVPKTGVMQVGEYRAFFADRVAEAIARAWKARKPGSVTWGLGHAVVAYNRRATYAGGRAQMYGRTNTASFRGLEGYEDHDVNTLFFRDARGKLIAMAVNVSCPAQEVESRTAVNADFWHPVRQALRKQYGAEVCVLGWTGAAGDQSPHLMYRKAADERMRKLRGLTRVEEIARRVVRAVDEAHQAVKNDRHADVPLVHRVKTLRLPMRLVTEAEHAEAKAAVKRAADQIARDPRQAARAHRRMRWYQVTVDRFERQKTEPKPTCAMELHVVRLGGAVVCTNAFELFTDFGIRIKARSPATQTFVVQLAGAGTYLPTKRAVRGGHYSAVVHSSLVGPEGGQVLVDRTVDLINAVWKDAR